MSSETRACDYHSSKKQKRQNYIHISDYQQTETNNNKE